MFPFTSRDGWLGSVIQRWALNSDWIAFSTVCLSRVITSLARKMRYWLTYFWTLCFVPPSPPLPRNLPFLHYHPFLSSDQVSFPVLLLFFIIYFSLCAHRFSQSRGQVRGHLAPPPLPSVSNLATKPSTVWRSVAPCQTFTLTPPNPSSLSLYVKKTPAGMLQWGGCEHSGLCGSKV